MRDRAFLTAVACVGALAVITLARNIREATAPLYGPPTVDREIVESKVEEGALSFREAMYYTREEETPNQDNAEDTRIEEDQSDPAEAAPKERTSHSGLEGGDAAGGTSEEGSTLDAGEPHDSPRTAAGEDTTR